MEHSSSNGPRAVDAIPPLEDGGVVNHPTARAAFAAGVRYAIQNLADSMGEADARDAFAVVQNLVYHMQQGECVAEILGERFSLDDDSANGGYYRAHPEFQRPA